MVETLSDKQKNDLIRFFIYTMKPEQRGRFMAELPVIYATLYPNVDAEIIVQHVRDAISGVNRMADQACLAVGACIDTNGQMFNVIPAIKEYRRLVEAATGSQPKLTESRDAIYKAMGKELP